MSDAAPLSCEVCGRVLRGDSAPVPLYVEVSEFGTARAMGKFCSMEHAAEWLSGKPKLVPYKHPWGPGLPGSKLYACGILLVILTVLTCFVIGLIAIGRALT